MANNAENVQIGKPSIAGGVWVGAAGSTLPTSATSAIDTAVFACAGYCSEDGVTNSSSISTSDIKAWGGDIVASPLTEKKDTFKWKMIEAGNSVVLKMVNGDDNVTGTIVSGITVKVNAKDKVPHAFIIDMQVSTNILKRITIPNGKITAIGDIVYKDGEPVSYEVTVTAFPDAQGNTHYEYIVEGTPSGVTYIYTAVEPVGSENPSSEGWYVLSGDGYMPTADTTVDTNKTYYERTEST
ncbi:MAG: phage tail protein [Lachnospiraceae bacterium]|nr:phage tail protein [Lachnospiraceae bacterium]